MRMIRHDREKPYSIKLGEIAGLKELLPEGKARDFQIHICGCGLSRNKPFCDGSHRKTANEEEGKVYAYNENGDQMEAGPEYK